MTAVFVWLFTLSAVALGQSVLGAGPPGAATGPGLALSAGYTYVAMPVPTAGTINLYGADLGAHVDVASRWGVTANAAYVRASNIFGTGHGSYVLTALAGPVFYPIERRNTRVFVRGLVGAGLVDSAVPVSGTHYVGGWVARLSEAVGGGLERSISGPFAVRVGADYLRTSFVDSNAVAHPQNNVRVAASILFHVISWHGRD